MNKIIQYRIIIHRNNATPKKLLFLSTLIFD
uniref:Uncharacterized protein n=1 Tax=virus sp. ctn3M15 TaxID=2825821 RepID=A0A8S5RLZ1_9VIRU|nr:MAG TPA: hypothetical protein [virus sp. ctn3M15]